MSLIRREILMAEDDVYSLTLVHGDKGALEAEAARALRALIEIYDLDDPLLSGMVALVGCFERRLERYARKRAVRRRNAPQRPLPRRRGGAS